MTLKGVQSEEKEVEWTQDMKKEDDILPDGWIQNMRKKDSALPEGWIQDVMKKDHTLPEGWKVVLFWKL